MRAVKVFCLVGVIVIGVVVIRWMAAKPAALHEAGHSNNDLGATSAAVKHPTTTANNASSVDEASSAQFVLSASNQSPTLEMKLIGATNQAMASTLAQKPKEPLHDPTARTAMSLVGVDASAEAYWLGAIFDASLPEGEREDLMEDLNEEGLSDAKHPGPQDLPVILNRLAIIEEILPFADEFMVTHLGEAYKDLVNLADLTQGGGEPVR